MLTRLKYENETTLGRLVRLTVDAEIGLDTSAVFTVASVLFSLRAYLLLSHCSITGPNNTEAC